MSKAGINNKIKKNVKRIAILAGEVAIVAAALYILWMKGVLLPGFITWNRGSSEQYVGYEHISFELARKRLTISDYDSGELIYQTRQGWKVSDYFFTDIDHDEEPEVVMVVWRQGSFGAYRPFWHDKSKKDNEWTQHIFIFDWDRTKADRLKAIWMSSAISIKAAKISIDEDNRLHLINDKGEETVWQWISWGLILVEVIPVD